MSETHIMLYVTDISNLMFSVKDTVYKNFISFPKPCFLTVHVFHMNSNLSRG